MPQWSTRSDESTTSRTRGPATQRGQREDPERGFRSFATSETGDKRRTRPESFADHYSQAGQFYRSQSSVEQRRIIDAFTFELSKVERVDIRERMVANLRNVDADLATTIANQLSIAILPPITPAAAQPNSSLPASISLSILANGPATFAGGKIGVIVTDGAPTPQHGTTCVASSRKRAPPSRSSPSPFWPQPTGLRRSPATRPPRTSSPTPCALQNHRTRPSSTRPARRRRPQHHDRRRVHRHHHTQRNHRIPRRMSRRTPLQPVGISVTT